MASAFKTALRAICVGIMRFLQRGYAVAIERVNRFARWKSHSSSFGFRLPANAPEGQKRFPISMTTVLVHKVASLGKIIKLIPGIAVKLDSIEARLGRMEEAGISEPRGRIEKSGMPEPQTFESLAKQNSLALSLTPAQIESIEDELVELIKQNPSQLARIDAVRRALALARFNGCADNLRRICSGDPDKVHAGSIEYNLTELSNSRFIMVERPSRLLFPLQLLTVFTLTEPI